MPKQLALDLESKTKWLSSTRLVNLDKPAIKCDVSLKLKFQGEKAEEGEEARFTLLEELGDFIRETSEDLSNQLTGLDARLDNASSLQAAEALVEAFQNSKLNALKTQLPGKIDTLLKSCAGKPPVKGLDGVKVGKCKCALDLPDLKLNGKAKKKYVSVALPEMKPAKVVKGKFGPRTYNLLSGVGSFSEFELPPALNVTIEVNYELTSEDVVEMAQLGDVCTEYIDGLRTTLKKALLKTNASIARSRETADIDTARAQLLALKRELALLELDATRTGKKVVQDAVREIADREVDVVVNKAEATVKCVFAVIKLSEAAEDIFTKPPGWNLISPLIKVVGSIATVVTTLRQQLSSALTLRDELNDGLIDLEETRSLAAKKWEEMSKTEVATELKDKVFEIAFGKVEGLEVTLRTFAVKVTLFDEASKVMGKKLNTLLEYQDQLKDEHAEEVANRVAPLIESIMSMQEQFRTLRTEETAFEKTLKGAKANTSKIVQLGVTLMQASELMKPVGQLEAACNLLVREAGAYAKKKRKI
jgi:hypothetical protein